MIRDHCFLFLLVLVNGNIVISEHPISPTHSDRPTSLMTDDGPLFCLALFAYLCALDIYVCPLSISIPSLFLVVSSFIRYLSTLSCFHFLLSLSLLVYPFPLSALSLSLPPTYFPPHPSLSYHRPSLTLLLLSLSITLYPLLPLPFWIITSVPSTPLLLLPSVEVLDLILTYPPASPYSLFTLTHSRIHPQAYTHTLSNSFSHFPHVHHNPHHYNSYALAPSLADHMCTLHSQLLRIFHLPPLPPPLFFNTIHLVFSSLSAPRVGAFSFFMLALCSLPFPLLLNEVVVLPHPPIEHHGERKTSNHVVII